MATPANAWALRGNLRGPAGPTGATGPSGAAGSATGSIPAGSTTPTITHELGTTDLAAFVLEGGIWRPVVYQALSATQVQFTFTTAPTAGQYRYLLIAGAASSAQRVPLPPVALTDGATISTDATAGVHFTLAAMAGDRVLAAPTGPVPGQRVLWEITASGARTLTLSTTGSRSFKTTTAVPGTTISIPDTATLVLAALYSASRDRFLVLAAAVTT